jgi:hypothetical protein
MKRDNLKAPIIFGQLPKDLASERSKKLLSAVCRENYSDDETQRPPLHDLELQSQSPLLTPLLSPPANLRHIKSLATPLPHRW